MLCIISTNSVILLFFAIKNSETDEKMRQIDDKSSSPALEYEHQTNVSFLKDEIITAVLLKCFQSAIRYINKRQHS
ncbi:hypothetical protein KHA80_01875 [Anaerobacillus sp. HL2]|nr:hypothetical protein KHA80_01875 [Anaerobacillus sp. HL2]